MARSRGLLAVVAGVAIACSSKGPTPSPYGPSDGGSEAGPAPSGDAGTMPAIDASGTVGGDSSIRSTACTAAPFVGFSATVQKLDLSGTSAPLAGATIGFSTCPGFLVTTDASGKTATQLTQGIALSPIYNAAGAIDAIGAELPATADVATTVTLFDVDVAPAIPGFEQDGGNAATIAISLAVAAGATAPCDGVSGATLSVTGHPEAVVSYAGTSWPASPTTTAASSVGSWVFIGGVKGAGKVAVTGARTGCTVSLTSASQTGSFQVVAGAITFGAATIAN